jgi:8-oxo-dGTP pyrophosphatase MutT (NUDIX family)
LSWLAVAAATRADTRRVPFVVRERAVGSVAVDDLDALRRHARRFDVGEESVRARDPDPTEALVSVNATLRELGLVRAWRDETFAIPDPATLETLALTERAAARFWGTLTFGAHATGFVRGADGRPAALWIAQRSPHKATDPGRFDNLIGGGVPAGQTPAEALVREGFEEAGLDAGALACARPAGVLRLTRDIAEGFQHEWLYSFDVELPPGLVPLNQDGEVAGFTLMPVAQAAALAGGDDMTVDAALVTLDFLVRHRLHEAQDALAAALAPLRVVPPRPR